MGELNLDELEDLATSARSGCIALAEAYEDGGRDIVVGDLSAILALVAAARERDHWRERYQEAEMRVNEAADIYDVEHERAEAAEKERDELRVKVATLEASFEAHAEINRSAIDDRDKAEEHARNLEVELHELTSACDAKSARIRDLEAAGTREEERAELLTAALGKIARLERELADRRRDAFDRAMERELAGGNDE